MKITTRMYLNEEDIKKLISKTYNVDIDDIDLEAMEDDYLKTSDTIVAIIETEVKHEK